MQNDCKCGILSNKYGKCYLCKSYKWHFEITNLKEKQYLEYKYRKQKYLLELDNESVKESGKERSIQRYNRFYAEKMDVLYKGILFADAIAVATDSPARKQGI